MTLSRYGREQIVLMLIEVFFNVKIISFCPTRFSSAGKVIQHLTLGRIGQAIHQKVFFFVLFHESERDESNFSPVIPALYFSTLS